MGAAWRRDMRDYQVRSNIAHRGKGVVHDHDTLAHALDELLPIFRTVLDEAKTEAERLAASY